MLEPTVFLYPSFRLLDEIQGHVDGTGLALLLVGDVVAGVLFPSLATATGPTALLADDDQTGGQDGTGGLELLDSGLAESSDQSGMFWYLDLSLPVERVVFFGKVL